MKIKVSEATTDQLDWLVAKCLGWVTYPTDSKEQGEWYHTNAAIAPLGYEHNRVHRRNFKPSTDWRQGGPIIEREWICADRLLNGQWIAAKQNNTGDSMLFAQGGTTPLIAAMRCFCCAKLGYEVEVSDL